GSFDCVRDELGKVVALSHLGNARNGPHREPLLVRPVITRRPSAVGAIAGVWLIHEGEGVHCSILSNLPRRFELAVPAPSFPRAPTPPTEDRRILLEYSEPVTRILFFEPRIAGNTGNTIRLAAGTGAELHIVNPLFDFEDAKLRRAGLDYHDLAVVHLHESFESALDALMPARIFAFTAQTS